MSKTTFQRSAQWALVLMGLTGLQAMAQETFPGKPVELVVPYPPGASTDFIARTLQPQLSANLGQPLIIDNRGGAGGNIGAAYVAKSPGNGYKLLLSTNATVTINPHVYRKPGFEPLKDFRAVALVASAPICITVNGKSGIHSLSELIANAKSSNLAYGTPGSGSPQHVSGELINEAAGIAMTHVPYRGIGPALTDLLGGTLPVMLSTCSAVTPHLASGALKVIAVTEKKRFVDLPNVPTVAETYPGFDVSAWFGIYVPSSTPDPVVNRLNGAITAALANPGVRKALLENALNPGGGKPEALTTLTQQDFLRWGDIVKKKAISTE